jgi:hypothetical protein
VWHLFNARRRPIRRLVAQIESDAGQLTEQSLELTLIALNSENRLRLMIQEGLICGSKAVTSPTFVRFCLSKYPRSEWFLRYVVFLFSISWGVQPDTYRILLHLLSVESLSPSTQLILFQFVFVFMQTADHSPIIARHLASYRSKVLALAAAHRAFWLSALAGDTALLRSRYARLVPAFADAHAAISAMARLFRFAPGVLCEKSIFEADFARCAPKATDAYRAAATILRDRSDFVCRSLSLGFSPFLLAPARGGGDPQSAPRFLSFRESYENAHRQAAAILPDDGYLLTFARVFTLENDRPPIRLPTCGWCVTLRIAEAIAVCAFVAFLPFHGILSDRVCRIWDSAQLHAQAMTDTVHFCDLVTDARVDIGILLNIASGAFGEFNFQLLRGTIDKLDRVPERITKFKAIVDWISEKGIALPPDFAADLVALAELARIRVGGSVALDVIDAVYKRLHRDAGVLFQAIGANIDNAVLAPLRAVENSFLALAVCEIALAFFSSILVSFVLHRILSDFSLVIQSAQPPVLSEIAHAFDRLLSSAATPAGPKRELSFILRAGIPLFFMFATLLPFPIAGVLIIRGGTSAPDIPALPPAPIFTVEQDFMIYSIAAMESDLIAKGVLRSCASGCYHEVARASDPPPEVAILSFSARVLAAWKIPTAILPCCLCIAFLWSRFQLQGFRIGEIIFKAFPEIAVRSNPVFNCLMRHEKVKTREVCEFVQAINTAPELPDFLCMIEFDDSGIVQRIQGRPFELIGVVPENIADIAAALSPSCPELSAFCRNREDGSSIDFATPDGGALSLTFGNHGRSLMIKDDSHNVDANQKRRLMGRLEALVARVRRLPQTEFERAALVAIEGDCDGLEIEGEGLWEADRRYGVLLLLADPAVPTACRRAWNVLEGLRREREISIAVGHVGGPMRIFEAKVPIAKPRCFGPVHDETLQLLRILPKRRIAVTREFLHEIGGDDSAVAFETIAVSEDRVLDVAFL